MSAIPDPVVFPELIFGIAGPIGVDIDGISKAIIECLDVVRYRAVPIKLTDEMKRFTINVDAQASTGKYDAYWWKMDYANALRRHYEKPDALARIAIDAIRTARANENIRIEKANPHDHIQYSAANFDEAKKRPIDRFAYIIRQLKHPEEVKLLRQVYGKQFVLISAYAPEDKRRRRLLDDIKASESTQAKMSDIEYKVSRLTERDASEIGENLGQQLRDTFHLADVFIDGVANDQMKIGIMRFIEALFGKADITPCKDEYGMYAAKSASLRSSDLARQIGAAIFSANGDLLVQGCNEVPKAGGGMYWDSESPDHRDIRKGFDPNDRQKRELLRDIIERLREAGHLSDALLEESNDAAIVEQLVYRAPSDSAEPNGPLADSRVMDLTEFGRVVHAEMCAICDAAREGVSIKHATLYCTTFPCHNCTKHIIASGLLRVVYMEPYPKSRAKELHEDEIQLESGSDKDTVSFVPFLGISPFRYRDIFQKGRRKSPTGEATVWMNRAPKPMLDIGFPAYTTTGEPWALIPLIGDLVPNEES
jgi:deoxycytidylate deaminase